MPLNAKGEKILSSMQEQYGEEKGKQVFYASKNAGKLTGVDAVGTNDANPQLQAPVPERQNLIGNVPTEEGGYQPTSKSNTSMAPSTAPESTATGVKGNTVVGSEKIPKDRNVQPSIGDAAAEDCDTHDEGEMVSTTASTPPPSPTTSIPSAAPPPPAPTMDRRLKAGDSNPVGDQSMRNWNQRNKAYYGV